MPIAGDRERALRDAPGAAPRSLAGRARSEESLISASASSWRRPFEASALPEVNGYAGRLTTLQSRPVRASADPSACWRRAELPITRESVRLPAAASPEPGARGPATGRWTADLG